MKSKLLSCALGCSLFLSGCSVVMAAHQAEDIDVSKIAAGTPRAEVETVLSNTIEEGGKRSGKTVTYQFFTNDEKSYGRAAVYGLLDLATVGFAEIATTSIEALQGDKHLVVVEYDSNGKLISLKETVEKAPLEKPERILGIEKDEPQLQPAVLTPPAPALPDTSRASM